MDYTGAVLLPHILQTLSKKPELCTTYENLCHEIGILLSKNSPKDSNRHFEKDIENALDVGENLGILTITHDLIRMPFKYNKERSGPSTNQNFKKRRTTLKKGMQEPDLSDENDNFGIPPRRKYIPKLSLITASSSRNRSGGKRRNRSGSKRRNRSRHSNRSSSSRSRSKH